MQGVGGVFFVILENILPPALPISTFALEIKLGAHVA